MPYYRHTNANKRKLLDSSFKVYQTTSNRSHLMNKHKKKYQRLNIYPIKGSNLPNIYPISKKYQRLIIYPIKGYNLPNIYHYENPTLASIRVYHWQTRICLTGFAARANVILPFLIVSPL